MAVSKVRIPPRETEADMIIDALAKTWNVQEKDSGAKTYFLACHRTLRARIIAHRLYSYSETDRAFLARHLLELADGIYEAVTPFVR